MATITLAGSTYSWIYQRPAADCLLRLADLGFERSEAMLSHPGILWPSESIGRASELRRTLAQRASPSPR